MAMGEKNLKFCFILNLLVLNLLRLWMRTSGIGVNRRFFATTRTCLWGVRIFVAKQTNEFKLSLLVNQREGSAIFVHIFLRKRKIFRMFPLTLFKNKHAWEITVDLSLSCEFNLKRTALSQMLIEMKKKIRNSYSRIAEERLVETIMVKIICRFSKGMGMNSKLNELRLGNLRFRLNLRRKPRKAF